MSSGTPTNTTTAGAGPLRAVGEAIADFGGFVMRALEGLGGMSLFGWRMLGWMVARAPRRDTLVSAMYAVGVQSISVVAIIGAFTGMVLAVQSFTQFRTFGLETQLGGVINKSMMRELGPVLAATMLAGRVGSAMAAELGTMRVTEQIDALASMGANPIHYLVVPRFLACLTMIPTLTTMAVFTGVVGGAIYCTSFLGIDIHHYRANAVRFVENWDLFYGIVKSAFFGAAIGVISCYRGFNCQPGAEGVGRAATTAFVFSFVTIIIMDLLLSIVLDQIYLMIWPVAPKLLGG